MKIVNTTRLAVCAATLLPIFSFAAPTVTDLSARQRYPWNGLVDISFTMSESGCIAIAATNTATGAAVPVRTLRDRAGNAVEEDTEFAHGEVSLVWAAGTDVPETLIETLALLVVGAPPHSKVQLWAGGPYWAETNIGAENPEDYGLYFWWGDTVGYRREGNAWVASDGSSSNFSFGSGSAPTYGKKYSTLQSEGWIVTKNGTYVLAPEHDAAQAHWGGNWRMPTKVELEALNKNCDWTWTTRNGVSGYLVRGRGAYSSASIFLPAAGYGNGTSPSYAGSYGYYWSSVPYESYSGYAWDLSFYSVLHRMDSYDRSYGQSVRPVQGFAE
ncbi:MAG: DUF1566 domain-containing protein [Kiritimatiellae bacterium]|nr:DUF1566 domain-containing protein [Kiritimatiellia bacterium]